ncbi:MAG TPA: tyrosine-protein phosphatase [Pyrinomonadaceae bacterium]|jgi:protein tyrosine phosphatase (PTP) superfamily phosphohydrolase (DUF442 family)
MGKRSGLSHAYRFAAPVVVAAMLALAGFGAAATQRGASGVSIENFGKVNETYYRGAQPDREGFAELKRLGVKTVVDLRKDAKREAAGWAREAGLRYVNLPLMSSEPATEEQTAYFLKLVNDPENQPVYVHCKGGRHRTGALTAVYRIAHDGWTADQAFAEMLNYDFDNSIFGGGGRAKQKKFVYLYYERHRPAGGAPGSARD